MITVCWQQILAMAACACLDTAVAFECDGAVRMFRENNARWDITREKVSGEVCAVKKKTKKDLLPLASTTEKTIVPITDEPRKAGATPDAETAI